ncbi:MAG: hypothetical protein KGM47_17935 [Acidobacteriota bacterium]|nr:hypothetical protein [Acidobacteriota bacterium]
MIQDQAYWKACEEQQILSSPLDFFANLRLLEAMFEEARLFGHFAPGGSIDGLEAEFRMAKVADLTGA